MYKKEDYIEQGIKDSQEQKKLRPIKVAFTAYIMQYKKEPETILSAIEHIKERYGNIYEEDNGIIEQVGLLNLELLAELTVNLKNNFSKERFDRTIEVLKKMYPNEDIKKEKVENTLRENNRKKQNPQLLIIAAVVLIAVIAVGLLLIIKK